MRSDSRIPFNIVAIAVVYLGAHLVFLAPTLEDIDSINFALGLRRFDVANHQPHPPGYPVYIALGHVSKAMLAPFTSSLDASRLDALALAIWSALGGAIALVAAFSIFSSFEDARAPAGLENNTRPTRSGSRVPIWATGLLAAAPLFWLAGSRPMSDMPGLALALAAQALFLRGIRSPTSLVAGAVLAGLAAGVRVQTACLTLPLFVFALVRSRSAGIWWILSRPIAAMAASALAWIVPLVVMSGGVDAYLRALGTQAGEDLAWTGMLWTTPTPRRLVFALWETFVLPWDSIVLGIIVGVLALAGVAVGLLRWPRSLMLAALAFAPYAVFHLLFQETIHVRYAMPTLVAIAWLVMCAVAVAGRLAPVAGGLVVAAALLVAVPIGTAYGREAHPAFRAMAAMEAAGASAPSASIYAHFSLRRPLQAAGPGGLRIVEPRRSYEWLGLVDYWRTGGRAPVWFLADPRRTDLALIDPQSRRDVTYFRWGVADRAVLSGTRPTGVDWYRFNPPGWFTTEGWALTPETGGIAQATGAGVDRRPIEAYVRRRPGPIHFLVGGRHFSAAGDPPVILALSIDGTMLETWKVDPGPGGSSFLRFFDRPDGLPPGPDDYARLTITAHAEPPSRPTPQIAIRQFDIQPAPTLIWGFGEGWHEAEYDNATGLRWRWTSKRSVIRVSPPEDVVIRVRGESPLKYFDAVPTVRISAGGRIVGELQPGADFEWRVRVPADAVRHGDGAIAIETDRVYLPGEVEGTDDVRQLGLRLFEIEVNPVTP